MNIFIVVSFFGLIFGTIYFAYRRTRSMNLATSEGLLLGGRSLGAWPIAALILMSNLSTEQLIGLNGQAYVAGMEVMAWEVTAAVAIVVLALIFLPKYFKYGVNTITGFLEIHFGTLIKQIMSLLFLVTFIVGFLPTVLFSAALALNRMFYFDQILGVSSFVAIALLASIMGIFGIIYLMTGGIKFNSQSDMVYGVGLLIAGFGIPILGIMHLGDGNFIGGLQYIGETTPEMLNSIGAIDSEFVPWPTLLTGMLFNNLYFWCTNQMIIQKSFTGKNLAESQKGVLLVGIFKIVGAFIFVVPGIIARNMFGDAFSHNPDLAYPYLVMEVLPSIFTGLFAAVIFGAGLSSFSNCLNATSTLISLDFYKPLLNKKLSGQVDEQEIDRRAARLGKMCMICIGIITTLAAPFIVFAPAGLFQFVQDINGIISMPLLVLVIAAIYYKKATPLAAKTMFITYVILYSVARFIFDTQYLYTISVLFFVNVAMMVIISKLNPKKTEFELDEVATAKVDITPWKHAKFVGVVTIVLVTLIYGFFSPLGIG